MRRRNSLLAGAKYLFVGSIAAGAFAVAPSVVHADGMAAPRAKATFESPANWSGFYAGLSEGYSWSSIDGGLSGPGGAGIAGPGNFSVDHDTEFWGLVLGVQHQIGGIVVGVEGNWLNMYRDDPGSTRCPNATQNCTSKLDDILSVGGRLGVPMGHWMPYVTGGYASASFSFRNVDVGPGGVAREDGRTRNEGWYAGVGFDMIVAPGWTSGLEYRHYDFGDTDAPTFPAAGGGGRLETLRQSATVDSVALRLTYKWDIPGRYAPAPLK